VIFALSHNASLHHLASAPYQEKAMATIEMEIEVHTEIGIAPKEIGRVQAVTVSLLVEVADRHSDAAAHSGQITDTLDYSRLRQIVHDTFKERRWSLLEEVTTAIRERIRLLNHVESARVGVTKHCPWADVPHLTLTR
jgi:dihydroneopterin aldolase